jgi:tRNA A-37 threonylcarbamoyl transferase component Bud32
MNDEALAELFFHLQLLNSSAPNPLQVSKGMLFGPGGCYLCTCTGQDITELECCATGTPGLVNKLQEFFSPFPYQAILSSVLMSSFKLEIVKPVEDYETSYLGAGAYGQVFKVKRDPEFNDNNLYALKIVNSHYDRFCREFSILYMHTKIECDCNLIASVPDFSSLLTFDDQHAAFVMSPVGVGLKRDDIFQKQQIIEVVELLKALHSHPPPFLHGDARYANIVRRSDDSLFWVDFAAAFPADLTREQLQVGFQRDMRTLVESLTDNPISTELLLNYGLTRETTHIINFIWRSTQTEQRNTILLKQMSKLGL